jgi:hypothetical protein
MRSGVICVIVSAGLLAGCATGPEREADASATCARQGHYVGTDGWRACMEAGGAAVATGPGSPYANADEDDMGADG